MLYNLKPVIKQIADAANLKSGLVIIHAGKELSHRIRSTGETGPNHIHEWSSSDLRARRTKAIKNNEVIFAWYEGETMSTNYVSHNQGMLNNEADIVIMAGIREDSLPYVRIIKARILLDGIPGYPMNRELPLIPITNSVAVENQNDGADIEEGMVIVRRQGFRSDDMASVVFNRERAVGFVQIPDLGIDWVVSTPVLATPVILLRGLCVPNEELGSVSHAGIPFSYIVREAVGYARNLLLLSAHGDPRVTPGNKQVSEMLQEYATAVITNNRSIAFPEYGNYDYGRKAITFTAKYGQLSSVNIELDK